MTEARYVRQMLLAEIGVAGQARLASAVAAVAGNGLCHEIASAYATRAGIGTVVPGVIDADQLAPDFLSQSAARAVVAGSRAALASMRQALTASVCEAPRAS